jgi:hypothetical protein
MDCYWGFEGNIYGWPMNMFERGLQYPVLRVRRGPPMIALVPGEVARCIYVLGFCILSTGRRPVCIDVCSGGSVGTMRSRR